MSDLKEPGFWSDDVPLPPGDFLNNYPRSLESYLKLFEGASAKHLAVGEASTSYSWSETAVQKILAFQPAAKFVCMVRNPLHLVETLHATEVYFCNEDERSFESAWRRQADRAHSADSNLSIRLNYRRIASLGTHVGRLFRQAPREQCLVIVYDDFARDVRSCYESTLRFLGVPSDGRTVFPVVNAARQHRFGWIPRLLMQPPRFLQPMLRHIVHPVFKKLGLRNLRGAILEKCSAARTRSAISANMHHELANAFRDEIELLSTLLDRDLSHWLSTPQAPSPVNMLPGDRVPETAHV